MPKASLTALSTERGKLRPGIVGRPRKPGFIETCNPSLVTRPPDGAKWTHEIKWDGYRAQAHLDDGEVKIYTRAGNDWSVTFFPVAKGRRPAQGNQRHPRRRNR